MPLTREQLLASSDRKTVDVDVEEWGGAVRVAVMTGAGRDQLQQATKGNTSVSFFEASLLVATLVDADGKPLMTESDVAALQSKSTEVVARVAQEAMRLNGLGKAGTEAAVGNSSSSQSVDSGTASPSDSASQ
jgi:hypothetical protein